MARRASTISTTSLAAFKTYADSVQSPGDFDALPSSAVTSANGQVQPPLRTSSLSTYSFLKHNDDNPYMDPDDLFTQRTVAEVKSVQMQLRADAHAKQEELRLMVGERYRDLLQASTSIISIARSSKRVIEALQETKEIILAQEEPPLPKQASLLSKEDVHLQILQLLSAHIKLLLDAPEHLWRLIERKKYFQAAWLFLLARVVHRALVRDDDQDEENWSNQGIDVMEQFPLVQRQWDAVSHFRTQIIHKATLSLRSYKAPPEDTCATLLTLHLLDSQSLLETFSIYLTQRSKTLHTFLGKHPDSSGSMASHHASPNGPQANGRPPEYNVKVRSPKRRIREVRQSTEVALDTISRTLRTAREVFQNTPPSRHSMISGVLEYIQSDTSNNAAATAHALPAELLLTTQTLLTALPSSTHFLLLPPNLRSYKPFVDLSSSTSSMPQERFTQKLNEWFRQALDKLHATVESWFSELESVQEVWSVRSWIRKWVATTSRLEAHEQIHLKNLLDDMSRQRMVVIWKAVLADAAQNFQSRLESCMSDLVNGSDANAIDASSVEYLFAATPLPTVPQGGPGLSLLSSPFQKYKSALQRQICGRTVSLDDILGPLESHAKALQHDFSQAVTGDGENTRILADQLREAYRPDAETLCSRIIDFLESAANSYIDSHGTAMISLAFIGRLADELSSSSTFLSTIGCGYSAAQDFRTKAAALDARITNRWRKYTVSRVATNYWISWHTTSQGVNSDSPTSPSATLMRSLLSLSTSIQRLGSSRDPSRLSHAAHETLRLFVVDLLREAEGQATAWRLHEQQALWDLALLRKFAELWGNGAKTTSLLDEKMAELRGKLRPEDIASLDSGVSEYFSRTQVLLAPLTPLASASPAASLTKDGHEKLTTLLSHGIPSSETPFLPALELAKPSSRFGVLLVGNTTSH